MAMPRRSRWEVLRDTVALILGSTIVLHETFDPAGAEHPALLGTAVLLLGITVTSQIDLSRRRNDRDPTPPRPPLHKAPAKKKKRPR